MTEHLQQETAQRVGESMFASDRASQALGMQLLEIMPGKRR